MATQVRTIDFLPEIFQTTPNQQFLSATLDTLVTQPNFNKVQGYIGSKFGYGVKSSDKYITEPTKIRNDYQFSPAVVFNKTGTNQAIDLMTYPGMIDAFKHNGAVTDNHNLLFSNEFYSWDSFVDLDKFINYSQYYWLPEGPEPVTVNTSPNYSRLTYKVTSESYSYSFTNDKFLITDKNPEITLVRGGTYEFQVNQDNPFWIQTQMGTSGKDTAKMNTSTREVFGVANNGTVNGTVTFTVPAADAQNQMIYPQGLSVDLATTMKFEDIQGKIAKQVVVDGVTYLNNKTIIFYGSSPTDTGTLGEFFDQSGDSYDDNDFDQGTPTLINRHYYKINYLSSGDEFVISLTEAGVLPDNQSILIKSGSDYMGRLFVKNSYNDISLMPLITAPLNELYYQDGSDVTKVGKIKLIDADTAAYLDVNNIIGQKTYTSPNNITFTNGLKVQFSGNIVPESYLNDLYYVEGVGTSIQLIPVSELQVPEKYSEQLTTAYDDAEYGFDAITYSETFYVPATPDYLTINRSSLNRNAWARSNRWFHADVLKTVIANNLVAPMAANALGNSTSMAKRPILEFYPNLKLFNYGAVSRGNVTFIDFNATDAMNQVHGQVSYSPDGSTSGLGNGTTVVFANDTNVDVRSKVYKVHIEAIDTSNSVTLSSVYRKIGTQVRFAIPTQAVPPTVGRYYFVSGCSNTNYNGSYIVTDSTQNTVTLLYPSDPGDFVAIDPIYHEPTVMSVQPEIILAPVEDIAVNEMVSVIDGETYGGLSFYFDGSSWKEAQQKTKVNQAPLFDLYDSVGSSLGDSNYYPGTDFTGCTLLEYAQGTGADDEILGFPLKYTSINNLGDVQFNVSINSQTFNYSFNGVSTTESVQTSYVYNYTSNIDYTRNIGWQTAADESFQYQVFETLYDGVNLTATFTLDVAMKDPATTNWSTIVVYVDNERMASTAYTVTTTTNATTVVLATTPAIGTPVVIMLYSDQVSKTGYYEIPSNLDSNPFNEAIQSLTLGDVRGHYKSICNNIRTLTGNAFGPNNFRDLGNLVPYGTRIIQNSAPAILPAAFTKTDNNNFYNAATFNEHEYEKFKTLLVTSIDLLNIDYSQPVATILDLVIDNITASGLSSSPFFWSDMIPSKTPTVSNTYSFKTNLPISFFQLSQVYDYTVANYNGVLVYLTRVTPDKGTVITQLVKDIDYVISDIAPRLEILLDLIPNDTITIDEYTQTYGSFVPSTPTKLGLYPSFLPEIVVDYTYVTPAYFIIGHDGSRTKLYGDYVDGVLTDMRDKLLFEFELRVYNNLKVAIQPPINSDQVIPGYGRDIGYTDEEFLQIYSRQFLNWVGLNRIDYQSQFFDSNNEYTWNYSGSLLKGNKTRLKQGNWRGVYLWLYDTTNPHIKPWEILGLMQKPTWWDSHYGSAPYTSENIVMWTDISNGYIWNNGNPTVNKQRVRPYLLNMLPVDSNGNLISPFTSAIGSYNFTNFKNTWNLGDMGPAEYAYRSSSSWPFDLMKIMALMKPTKFFTYNIDLDVYRYSEEFNQYLVYNRLRTDVTNTNFYGKDKTSAQHSYINWIVDYQKQFGINGTDEINNVFKNSTVKLTYRLAGFSDKSHLRFILEKSSETASSLMIPEDSYSVMLYNNQPTETIVYSSIIVQRSNNGYKVYGNKQINAYFNAYAPTLGKFTTIDLNDASVQIPMNFTTDEIIYPYGTEFTTVADLLTFIKGYGLYLEDKGFQFNYIENGLTLSWDQMLYEVYYWILTGWEVGSTININPAAYELTLDNGKSIVQPLTLQKDNFVLNQNLLPIQVSDLAIERKDTKLNIKTLNPGDSISLFNAVASTIEHVIVFDNTTVFNDLMYNPVTGLRQQRIFMKGSKSADWNGTLNAAGFILAQDNIQDWTPNAKYIKGTVVNYKNSYWMANTPVVQPSPTFNKEYWDETTYEMVQQNMLPNLSTKSVESIKFYNTNQANLSNDADLLSFSLIGYRPRPYLSNAGLDDSTQVNLFTSMIESKGTNKATDGLNGITLNDNELSYAVHENWAIKNSEYSGVNNQNFVEIALDRSKLTGNPSIVSIVNDTNVDGSQQQIPLYHVKNYARNISNENVLETLSASSVVQKLPTAGYVNVDDVVEMGFTLSDLTNNGISAVYRGDYVWIANISGSWNVYTPIPTNTTIVSMINNLNGTATLNFSVPHNLYVNQIIGVLNFDSRINGYYLLKVVPDSKSAIISIGNLKTSHIVYGEGTVFLLQSQRVTTARDIALLPNTNREFNVELVWVDENQNGDWTVYSKTPNYMHNVLPKGTLQTVNFGSAVANIPNLGYMVGDSGTGAVHHYRDSLNGDGTFFTDYSVSYPGTTFGANIVYCDDMMIVSAPDESMVVSKFYFYRIPTESNLKIPVLEQIIPFYGGYAGHSMALSGDGNVLYVGAKDDVSEFLFIFARNPDLSFADLGFVLSKPTVLNDNKFTVEGDVLADISQGQRVSFVTQYTSVGTVKNVIPANDAEFVMDGDLTSTIFTGIQLTFDNTGTIDNSLFTVTHTNYDPGSDVTTIYLEEMVPATIYNGNVVYTVTFSQDVIYTVITGIYDADTDETTFYLVEKVKNITPAGASVYHAKINFQLVGETNAPVVSYGDDFGASVATNYDGTRVFVGSPNADYTSNAHTVENAGRVWIADALVENYQVTFDQDLQAPFYAITIPWIPTRNSAIYWNGKKLSSSKYIIIPGNVETNVGTIALIGPVGFKAGDIISFRSYNLVFSQYLLKSETFADLHPGENFGYSLACNKWGSELLVGAPNAVVDNDQEGAVIRFICENKKFGSMTGLTPAEVIRPTYLFINGFRISLDQRLGATSSFQQGATTISIRPADAAYLPAAGIITLQSAYANNYTMEYTNVNATTGVITLAIPFATDLTSTAYPSGIWPAADITVIAPIGHAYKIQERINSSAIPNVYAFVSTDSLGQDKLVIKLLDTTLGQPDNKLNVAATNGNILTQLGMGVFTKAQTITNPHPQHNSQFGHVVKFSDTGSIVIGAPVTNRHLKTTLDFDYTVDAHNQTSFDNNLTEFVDSFTSAGAAYMFDYIPCYNESLSNISNFVYAQPCNDTGTDYGYLPMYGKAIDFRNNVVMVGSPNFKVDTEGGKVVIYKNSLTTPNWNAYRYPDSIVDISKVKKVQLYDNTNDKTLVSLDYIDPLQGKFLGAVAQNLDYVTSIDPAGYNSANQGKGNSVWNRDHVGRIWFDTSTSRFLDYHQNDVVYNSKYWGQVFPGSAVDIYTWIESINPPTTYAGSGTVYDKTKYAVTFVTDSNGNLVPTYFYWVKNTNKLYSLQGKTLSDSVIAKYITNPTNSGISFMAPLRSNTFGLFNSQPYINGVSTNLHVGYSTSTSDVPGHIDFKLIRTDYPEDYLSGFPNAARGNPYPTGIYEKLIDSFAGSDSFGESVPDPGLPKMLQIGINVRPRQSMFVDRFTALRNFLEFTNNIIINYPVAELENLTLLQTYSDTFDTRLYWSYTYWWAAGFSSTTKTNLEVQLYSDLLTFTPTDKMIVGVAKNGKGKREVYQYSNSVWTRIGLEDGTIQFSSVLYDYANNKIGFGNEFFDSLGFDEHPTVETRYIVRAINEQIFINDLFKYRNDALILMFEYIQSESVSSNGYLPWLNKTSFADVSYNVRTLSQDTKYRTDNLGLLDGYINEIKPYHVVIKEFTLKYNALDVIAGTVSDFDLPIFFDTTMHKFVSPQLTFGGSKNTFEYSSSNAIWSSDSRFSDWYTHYGLSLVDSPDVVVAFVAKYLRPNDTSMYVDNARGMPFAGTILIDAELISYTGIDRETGLITGLNRGLNATQPTFHIPGVQIVMDVPSVTLLNTGRDYTFLPNVTAYIDTAIYPAPTTPAILSPIMAGTKVVGIQVNEPGEGYVVLPEIIIDPSISMTFAADSINNTGLIVLNTFEFQTGDLVRSTGSGTNGLTFIPNGYYYINVLHQNDSGVGAMLLSSDISFITFHKSYSDSIRKINPISFTPKELLSSNYSHTIGVTAYAVAYANNTLVRGMRTTLKFDRTSYRSTVVPWVPNHYWSSTFHSSADSVNSYETLSDTVIYVNQIGTASPMGGQGAVFTVTNWIAENAYQATITNSGSGYSYLDVITISGTNLEGSSANNCLITVEGVNGTGGITSISVEGTPAVATTASLQSAVLPILGLSNSQGNAVITVDYSYSGILPGQASGTSMFFYRIYDKYVFADTGGAEFHIFRPTFDNGSVIGKYYITVVDGGTGYVKGQQLRILGSLLGGVNYTNDAIIEITEVYDTTAVYTASVSGTPVSEFGNYYVKAINDTQLAIYHDATLRLPVSYSSFTWNGAVDYATYGYGYPGTDYAYLPEPLHSNLNARYSKSSLVSYANTIWQCVQSNRDSVFDPTKWVPLSQSDLGLNALDRIEGFYQPSLDLPAKDIQQLLKGTAYPNPVYYGNSFSPEEILPLDSILIDRPFYPVHPDVKDMIFDGTTYYGVVDTPTETVLIRSTDSTVWYSTKLSDTPLGVTGISYIVDPTDDAVKIYVISTTTPTTNLLVSFDTARWLTIGSEADFDTLQYDIGDYDITTVTAPNVPLYNVKSLNGKFYAVGKDILSSTDGLLWNIQYQFYSRLTNEIYDIDYIENTSFIGYIAVGFGSQIVSGANTAAPVVEPTSRILTSGDGINWEQQISGLSEYALKAVAHNTHVIVVAGENASIFYSVNGANWVPATISGSPVTATINSVAFNDGLFVAVGNKVGTSTSSPGLILTSVNGITWTQRSNSAITTENLHNVMFDGNFFYVLGDNDTIIRSVDGIVWVSQSNLATEDPTYVVKGNDFLFGYGPEELIPGIVSDTLTMQVNTAPSAHWNLDNTGGIWYHNTGFATTSIRGNLDIYHSLSFEGVALNPVAISVFVYDSDFSSYSRIYENIRTNLNLPYTYTVDWSARTVTLNRALSDTQVLMVEVYEAGNALELARGNSDTIPLRTDELSGHTMIVLENGFKTLPIDPLIFVSGVKLEYNVDYSILPYNDGTAYPRMKIQFNTLYDPSVDRIVYYIFDDSITPNNSTQYNYSYPETETFIGTTDSVDEDGITYTLSLSADGANPTHAFVELDGLRLIPTVDYSIAGNILTLTNPIDDSRTLAYTTFNDISRMYMSTTTKTAITSGNLSVTVPHPTVPNPMPDINYSDVNTTWVSLNGRLLEPSRYSYDSSNHLTITGVSNGDQVIVTARVDGGSPNPSGFKLLVNKSGETSVYRTNPQDRTWVMLDFDIKDDTFHVDDVTKLVEVLKVTNTVVAIDPSLNLDNDNDIGFLLDLNISNVSHVEAYNISKGLALARADIELEKFKGVNGVGFYDANTEIDDVIQLTLYIGNVLESNGERMLFTQLDPVANTITGIKRGIQNTVITTHTKYDYVYGLNPARKLNPAYYSEIWGSSNYTALGDPLQISTTDAAIFLNSGNQ